MYSLSLDEVKDKNDKEYIIFNSFKLKNLSRKIIDTDVLNLILMLFPQMAYLENWQYITKVGIESILRKIVKKIINNAIDSFCLLCLNMLTTDHDIVKKIQKKRSMM